MGEGGDSGVLLTPRALVLGGGGMLGHKIVQRLAQDVEGTSCTLRDDVIPEFLERMSVLHGGRVFRGVDVLRTDLFHEFLRRLRPDVIVNCVGLIKQRGASLEVTPSLRINAVLPHELARLCTEWGGRLIHFSTDCVFSGHRGNYVEDDPSDAEDLYGRSKYLGEVSSPNAVTLRTSIIGRELTRHASLLDWFLSQNGKRVRGFRRAIYSGVTTNEMAILVSRIVREWPTLSGLFHIAADPISKYDLLSLVRAEFGLHITLEPDDREVCDRSMNGDKFSQKTDWRAPSWPEMIATLAADPTPYRHLGEANP